MRQIVRKIFIPASLSLLLGWGFSGCASLSTLQDGKQFSTGAASNASKTPHNTFEQSGLVPAANFLGEKWMRSEHHRVEANAYNDGYSNTYRILTPDHIFVVRGTQNAKNRIHEIEATNTLRGKSTIGTAANAAVGRVTNLVETPVRALQGGAKRFSEAQTTSEKFMVVPSGIGEIIGNLASGLNEMGKTGVRITAGAAGTKCKGVGGCVSKAGSDIWSGINSLAGKHNAAREIHKSLGTDPYSENKILQREVDRLSYADAYISTGVKFGMTWSSVHILDPTATYIGYYNNAEFLSIYEDAHKRRDKEKNMLRKWGAKEDIITQLYQNEAFTHTSRTRLAQSLGKLGNADYRVRLLSEAATSKTRFAAQSRLSIYQYLAALDQKGDIKGFVSNAPSAIAITNEGALILPFAADYLKWTDDMAGAVTNFAALADANTKAEIHVLGRASPLFKHKAKSLGILVREIL